MNYYKLINNTNLKEVGKIPQSEEGVFGDIQQDFIPWKGSIDFDFKLPEPKLEKKTKRTSFLNVAFIHPRFLILDDYILNILKKFNIGNYQNWKIKVFQNNTLIEDYNLFFLNETNESECVNFKESDFLIGKIGDWRNTSLRETIFIEDYNHYTEIKHGLRQTKDKKRIRCNKIALDLLNISEDLFRINDIPNVSGYYVSERLKDSIEKNFGTGMIFKEISELEKVKII